MTLFKYCNKCIGVRQFKTRPVDPTMKRYCDMCGAEE